MNIQQHLRYGCVYQPRRLLLNGCQRTWFQIGRCQGRCWLEDLHFLNSCTPTMISATTSAIYSPNSRMSKQSNHILEHFKGIRESFGHRMDLCKISY